MKYYLIVGEASGDLHASRLMQSLQRYDSEAYFRFFGGDKMSAVGGARVRHYKELAYMGFIPVLMHLPTIFRNMRVCKEDILKWQPDVVIFVDYPGFNLDIAKFLRSYFQRGARSEVRGTSIVSQLKDLLSHLSPRTPHLDKNPDATPPALYYYISPKIWAWKEWRIKSIKRDIDEMFSILPFEKDFYEKKHRYPIHYVGNPTAEEVAQFQATYHGSFTSFTTAHQLSTQPIIALLAGSRRQEIKDNLPGMIEAARRFEDYQLVLAGAPSIDDDYYAQFIQDTPVRLVRNKTYELLSHATAALVTSGTATLETALFNVPQVVCYETPLPKLYRFGFNHVIKVKYISLVNLVADREVVPELLADRFTVYNIANELHRILPGQPARETMQQGYAQVKCILGTDIAPDNAARIMVEKLRPRSVEPVAESPETAGLSLFEASAAPQP